MLGLLKERPYKAKYHQFLAEKFGETQEVVAIRDYFGVRI